MCVLSVKQWMRTVYIVTWNYIKAILYQNITNQVETLVQFTQDLIPYRIWLLSVGWTHHMRRTELKYPGTNYRNISN